MRKRRFTFFVCFLLLLSLGANAFAQESMLPLVIDGAALLGSEQEQVLEETAKSLRERYQMDVVILTLNTLNGKTPQDYADDFYDDNGYGVGKNYSGVLFLLSMEERDWYISTCGDAIYALTDYGIQQLGEASVTYLSRGDYYTAFRVYLQNLETYLDAFQNGNPLDGYANYSGSYYHGDRENVVYYKQPYTPSLLLSVVIGLAVSVITLLCMRGAMNTKRAQRSAAEYMVRGSYNLRTQRDIFLYGRVSKTRRESDSGGHHGGGGSSVHHSSGGHSHGGGGGKF